MAAESKKCKHPNCSCTVSGGESYCSVRCEASAKTPEVDCKRGHAGCKGKVT